MAAISSSTSRKAGDIARAQKARESCQGLYPDEWNNLPHTRNQAKNSNPIETHYFNANKCADGHLERRFTSTGMCCACLRIRQKKIDHAQKEKRARAIIERDEFRICPECNIPFLMLPEYQEDRKFCSKKCNSAEGKRKWVANNPQKRKEVANKYAHKVIKENGPRYKLMKERSAKSKKDRYENDPKYRVYHNYRTRLQGAIRYQKAGKNAPTLEFLDSSIEEFCEFIEKQFSEGMTWNNNCQDGWHLDHVRPCQSFDFDSQEQAMTCFNFRNFQPLWADENLRKKDTYDSYAEQKWSSRMRALGYKGELFLLFQTPESQ